MKKLVLFAGIICSVLSLSSCCRIIDCCFEDPCAPSTSSCGPCEMKKTTGGCSGSTSKPSCK